MGKWAFIPFLGNTKPWKCSNLTESENPDSRIPSAVEKDSVSAPKWLFRSFSLKLQKLTRSRGIEEEEEEGEDEAEAEDSTSRNISSSFTSFPRFPSRIARPFQSRRASSIPSNAINPYDCSVKPAVNTEKASNRFNNTDEKIKPANIALPDDILEMCLAWTPFATLIRAQAVCKKWRDLILSPHFAEMRKKACAQQPWLLLFGISRESPSTGQIQALDPSFNKWRTIKVDPLLGRFLYSAAAVGSSIYIVGGMKAGTADKGLIKTEKAVLVYNPTANSWKEVCSMHSPRAIPVVGVFDIRCFGIGIGIGGGLSRDSRSDSSRDLVETGEFSSRGLIVVGGQGVWNEALNSVEIYDPRVDLWSKAASVPLEYGVVCTGAVCGRVFYVYSDLDKLVAFHFELNSWSCVHVTNPPPRLHEYTPRLVVCEGRLFMLGVSWRTRDQEFRDNNNNYYNNNNNNNNNKVGRIMWEFERSVCAWVEMSRHPDAPLDWNAVLVSDSRARVFVVEMFRIFGQVLDFITSFDTSNPCPPMWDRVLRMRISPFIDVSSCITKTVVVASL